MYDTARNAFAPLMPLSSTYTGYYDQFPAFTPSVPYTGNLQSYQSGLPTYPTYNNPYPTYDTSALHKPLIQATVQKESNSFDDASGGESPTYMSTSCESTSPQAQSWEANTSSSQSSRSSEAGSPEEKPKRRRERKRDIRGRPPYSYIALISMAIANSPHQKCTLKDIIDFINQRFEYYRNATNKKCWMGSIRHNLTLNECFIKLERDPSSRGHYWGINPEFHDMFDEGSFLRRRFRFKKTSDKKKKVAPKMDIKTESIRNNLVTLTAAAQTNAVQHLCSTIADVPKPPTPPQTTPSTGSWPDYSVTYTTATTSSQQPTYLPAPYPMYTPYAPLPPSLSNVTSSLSNVTPSLGNHQMSAPWTLPPTTLPSAYSRYPADFTRDHRTTAVLPQWQQIRTTPFTTYDLPQP